MMLINTPRKHTYLLRYTLDTAFSLTSKHPTLVESECLSLRGEEHNTLTTEKYSIKHEETIRSTSFSA